MFRTSIAALFLLGVPAVSVAAHGGGGQGGGHGGVAGGRSGVAGGGLIVGPLGLKSDPRGSALGGFVPPGFRGSRGFPVFGIWGGYGGYYYPGVYYPDWYNFDGPTVDMQPIPSSGPYSPDEPRVELSNEFPATLTVQLPAPGHVWVSGNKGEGKPNSEWILNSPMLKLGQEFKFDVTARWTVNDKTFEYMRTIPVVSGNRSKVLVLEGDEVK